MTKYNTFKLASVIIVTFICYGIAFGLAGLTLVNHSVIVAGCVAVAVLSSLLCSGWRTASGVMKKTALFVLQAGFISGLSMALVYGLNFAFPSFESLHKETAIVERVYSETRYHKKRVGRNRYVNGEPYKVFYMEVGLPGGWHRSLPVGAGEFRHRHKGDTVDLPVVRGLFGMYVIRRDVSLAER